ncbi:ead/Ea22-like family protein [Citrobacter amalonaticus]|uniref:Uncharacterized protein n=1 Tax=Citrobacter amalonaticus TaxID=35703 RepID=A0AAX2BPT9_CITAM|nr:ead/Ea22-like family protein [Citrobacter amalonaticus]SBA31068.1 protein of unknown function [Citrobacter amalonaticus]
MTDKLTQRMRNYFNTAVISGVKLLHLTTDELSGLLDELEAAENRIAEVESQRRMAFMACNRWADKFREAEKRVAELEAMQGKPVMFIDGDISSADADKLAAVIREFKEETETPAARMARIIRENPHPTNMCDMPSTGTGKGE